MEEFLISGPVARVLEHIEANNELTGEPFDTAAAGKAVAAVADAVAIGEIGNVEFQDSKDDDGPLSQNRYEMLPKEVKTKNLPKKLFHGSSRAKEAKIRENSLNLKCISNSKNQFGRGFYMTTDFKVAKFFGQVAHEEDVDKSGVVICNFGVIRLR